MLITLIAFVVAFAVIVAIRKAVENGRGDRAQAPVRRGRGWHNPNDRRAD